MNLDYQALFNESYEHVLGRAVPNHTAFFQRFYQIFIGKSEDIADKFSHTDMTHQVEMMRLSLSYLINFFVTKQSNSYLNNLARLHGRNDFDIEPDMYDSWLDALVETVGEHCPIDDKTELAWRIIMAPGIAFMRYHYNRL